MDTVEDMLLRAIEEAGSQAAFCRLHDIRAGNVCDVLKGRRRAGPKILAALGLRRTVVVEKVEAAPTNPPTRPEPS